MDAPDKDLADAIVAFGSGPDEMAKLASPANPEKYRVIHIIVKQERYRDVFKALSGILGIDQSGEW